MTGSLSASVLTVSEILGDLFTPSLGRTCCSMSLCPALTGHFETTLCEWELTVSLTVAQVTRAEPLADFCLMNSFTGGGAL